MDVPIGTLLSHWRLKMKFATYTPVPLPHANDDPMRVPGQVDPTSSSFGVFRREFLRLILDAQSGQHATVFHEEMQQLHIYEKGFCGHLWYDRHSSCCVGRSDADTSQRTTPDTQRKL